MSAKETIGTWGPLVLDAGLILLSFGLDHYDVLSGWFNDAYPVVQPILFVILGTFGGLALSRSCRRREINAKDDEIAELKKVKRRHEALFTSFRSLTHNEQCDVVNVSLSEPDGVQPSEELLNRLNNGVLINDFLRLNPSSGAVHIRDGVTDMLLENPEHVFCLMASLLADFQNQRAGDSDEILALTSKVLELEAKVSAKSDSEPIASDEIDAAWNAARDDGGEVLTGDDALNLIRMLTDNQKSALVYFYKMGGSAEADPLDAELIELSRLGLLQQPAMFVPGMSAKWVVPINVNKILADHPDLLDDFLEDDNSLPVCIETLQRFSPSFVCRVIEMAESGKDVPFQQITREENESLLEGDGIFERPKMVFSGCARDAEFYRPTREWRLFLSEGDNLEKARIVARMKS